MDRKLTYEELEQRVKELEKEVIKGRQDKETFQEKDRAQQYLDIAGVMIVALDSEGNITLINRKGCEVLGDNAEELIGKNWLDQFIPERMREDTRSVFQDLMHGEIELAESFKNPVVTKNGEERIFIWHNTILKDKKGRIVGTLSSGEDITELKRAEDELREKKEWLSAIQDRSPIPTAIGGSDGSIISFNKALEELTGYKRLEIADIKDWANKLYPDKKYRNFVWKNIQQALQGEKQDFTEFEITRKDGSTKTVEFHTSFFKGGLIVQIVDITERKLAEEQRRKLEAQLQHAQKMESIGTLTSGVAHNFRNLLTPISLYAQFVQMKYKDDPQLQEMAERTLECVAEGTQLVKGLMHFSRKHSEEIVTIDLCEVLRETYRIIAESFDKKIEIRIDIADSLQIRGNHSWLSQVFMNLCTNARDAMPDGGELSIEASKKGGKALVTISDTGIGMDEQTRKQCFDPFFTTKDTDNGTGLGLSTTYGIVKEHGGEIQVFSELNEGTTFKLYFPMAFSDEYQRRTGAHEIVKGSGEKVLIIDDETDILEALILLAERLDYSAASADNGKAGIDKYKSWQPDVVLLDRSMPGMDGIKCARSILEYDPEARIVLISGYDEFGSIGIDDKTKALIKGYLTKPLNINEISQTIQKALDKD